MKSCRFLLGFVYLALCSTAFAQSTNASLTGFVDDPSKAVIPKVSITAINTQTGVKSSTITNGSGQYVLPGLIPGTYRIEVDKQGFKGIIEAGLTLHVQDVVQMNFHMAPGSMSETVTVNANGLNINTTDGSVSTVIDRQFVENMPLNGRSFQNLLTLAPGVAQAASGGVGVTGEIVVNGQRTEANYFAVDGVSANTGATTLNGAGLAGSLPGESILGTTQSLVSVDAMQEFRASTSTYSAEFGRTPGGQFSLTTRSGTNDWHGTAFDYFRNDAMDANNWFNNAASPQVPREAERQNDFGGTLGGPIIVPRLYNGKDRTFFFFSYEGLRLTVPQPFKQFSVPDPTLRANAPVALQPFLNAFPLPSKDANGNYIEDGLNDGLGLFNQFYSSPSSLDNVGIRVDQNFGTKLKVFGRYSETPSTSSTYQAPAFRNDQSIHVSTITVGATTFLTPTQVNELRFNITQNNAKSHIYSTSFGGATPFDTTNLPGPNGQPWSELGSTIECFLGFGGSPDWYTYYSTGAQRQYNVVDTHTWSIGKQQIKAGVDWRRLNTYLTPISLDVIGAFYSESSVLTNSADFAEASSDTSRPVEPVYYNFSAFVQDEWKATSRLSLSIGLRWDVNPPPGNLSGPPPYTVDQITDLSTTQLAKQDTPLWHTDWHGFAPRVGAAYQLHQSPSHQTVLRGGVGVFYDLGNINGSRAFYSTVGFTSSTVLSNVSFPLTSAQVTLPPPSTTAPYNANVEGFDPNLTLPYTLQWNGTVEQAVGSNQTITLSYVGSAGRNLLRVFGYTPATLGNPNFSSTGYLYVNANGASSSYNSLQVKYERNVSRGLRVLGSYTWSHSIDDSSANETTTDFLERASSDFDVRHNLQTAVTYDIPSSYREPALSTFLAHWGIDARIGANTGVPVDVLGQYAINPSTGYPAYFHPNIALGQPLYLHSAQYPGGRIINYDAFSIPVSGPGATSEGDTPRNFARGFDTVQTDLALRRDFPIHDRLRLQFRGEAFNAFNRANFGAIYNYITYGPALFGHSYQTQNISLGGLNSLYQNGGPRSIQLMLKLAF